MKSPSTLGIFGWGTYLPPVHSATDLITKAGGDPGSYLSFGWKNICVAAENDHPVSMATASLKKALSAAGIGPEKLKLVICTSFTHDYLELSSAEETAQEIGTPPDCLSFDITNGCLGTLSGMEIARDWLESHGGGYAAIISGERWAAGMDKRDKSIDSLWGFSDGASAVIVGIGVPEKPRINYYGSCFYTNNELIGHMRREYGGTRHPSIPNDACPTKRLVRQMDSEKLQKAFIEGYGKVISEAKTRFGGKPEWAVCNQATPGVLEVLTFLLRLNSNSVAKTGDRYGHVGCSDIVLGLEQLQSDGRLKGKGIALACTPSSWGAAWLEVAA